MDTQKAASEVKEKVEELLDKVDTVIQQQKSIAKKEEVILEQVAVEEKTGETVEEEVETVEKEEEMSAVQKNIITRVKHHKLLFPLLTGVGVILLWRGLWDLFDQIPIISYSFISIALGIIILWAFNRLNSI